MNIRDVTDNKNFSKTGEAPIVIKEIKSDDFDIADTLNRFFVNIVLNLKIKYHPIITMIKS